MSQQGGDVGAANMQGEILSTREPNGNKIKKNMLFFCKVENVTTTFPCSTQGIALKSLINQSDRELPVEQTQK